MTLHGPRRSLRQSIPGGYLARVRGGVWEEFVVRVVDVLVEAAGLIVQRAPGHDHQADPSWWADGRRLVRGQEVAIALEDSVTDALRRSVMTIRRDLSDGDFLRRNEIYVAEQQPRHRQSRLGSRARTTDLQFASLLLDYLDLRVEAKTLFGDGDVDRYCGVDGLMRFADGEPYTDKAVGMMLGFTFRHDDDHWHARIARTASERYGVETFEAVEAAGRILRTCSMTWPGGGTVRVVHMMLSFPSCPCARAIDEAA